jgi:hypothetical protein
MIKSDITRSHDALPVGNVGDDDWWIQYLVMVPGVFHWGHEFLLNGELQAKNQNPFNIEYRIGLFLEPEGVSVNPTAGPINRLHPITGENVGSYQLIVDKYRTLTKTWYYAATKELKNPVFTLRCSARSTQAIESTRLGFGNGHLQVRY